MKYLKVSKSPFLKVSKSSFLSVSKSLLLIVFTILILRVNGQQSTINSKSQNIYLFLEELASYQVIQINSAVRPFSRKEIAEKLVIAEGLSSVLNDRLQKELSFYLLEYEKEIKTESQNDNIIVKIKQLKSEPYRRADLYFYRDSFFTMWVNPIGGYQNFANQNGSVSHQWAGLEANAYVNNNWNFYLSFRDNQVSQSIMEPTYLTTRMGEDNKGGVDFSDMRGGFGYHWKWGSVGFVKDEFIWGNSINSSNIFSGKIPTIPQLRLNINPVDWFEFKYIHAWLVSEVVDSNSIIDFGGGAIRKQFYNKYLAANIYTLKLWKYLNVSTGNSMVYSNDNIQPGYLIPFIFFKSIEHTIAASNENNAQIFFDFSSRNIKHLHLYATWLVDEVNFSKMWIDTLHSNWFSYKAGFRLYNWPVNNIYVGGEWTRTNPMVFKHYYPTSTFESNQYNLGHYLKDNSQEYYFDIGFKPTHKLRFKGFLSIAQKGPDYPDIRNTDDYYSGGKVFMTEKEWSNTSYGVSATYELFHDAFISLDYLCQDIWAKDQVTLDRYTAPFYQGKTNTMSFRINFGF